MGTENMEIVSMIEGLLDFVKPVLVAQERLYRYKYVRANMLSVNQLEAVMSNVNSTSKIYDIMDDEWCSVFVSTK